MVISTARFSILRVLSFGMLASLLIVAFSACSRIESGPPSPDRCRLILAQNKVAFAPGGSISVVMLFDRTCGLLDPVNFREVGVPSLLRLTFDPPWTFDNVTTRVTVQAPPDCPPGVYDLVLAATSKSSSLPYTIRLLVTVQQPER